MRDALRSENLMVAYADLNAVWDVTFQALPGRITAILGRNGAGKSTTLLATAGVLPLVSGRIELAGTDISHMAAHHRVRAGISLVPEGHRLFRRRTVDENLRIGVWTQRRDRRRSNDTIERAYDVFPVLAERRRKRAGDLSGGQQQMLAIAQALASEPRFLLLDEPSGGLAPAIVQETFEVIKQLTSDGLGIVLVEQLLDRVLPVADDVVVMDRGRTVLAGPTHEVDHETVRALYFGEPGSADQLDDQHQVEG